MYVIVAPIQIKPGYKDRFLQEMIGDAKGSAENEPGCLRFDVIQDANDEDRIWVYEVYLDQDAFNAHTRAPHFSKFRDAVADWRGETTLQGAGSGAHNIWPPDDKWNFS